MVDRNKLNSVLEFTYLGSNISRNGCIDDEIQRRMAKASASFGRLRQRLWNNHHVSMRVKDDIPCNRAVHPPIRSRAWTVYKRQVKKLHAFMSIIVQHLRSITWMDKGHTRPDRAATYGRSSDQKESPVDWTPHQDVTRRATKADDSLLSTVFWSQKERAPSSPV